MFVNKLFYISHVRISQKVKGALMRNFNMLVLYKDEDIGRFSNLY